MGVAHRTHEGEPPASSGGFALGCRGARRSDRVVRWQWDDSPEHTAPQATGPVPALEGRPRTKFPDRDLRVSVQLPKLGSRIDERSAHSDGDVGGVSSFGSAVIPTSSSHRGDGQGGDRQ